jgi:hypothetical protein
MLKEYVRLDPAVSGFGEVRLMAVSCAAAVWEYDRVSAPIQPRSAAAIMRSELL